MPHLRQPAAAALAAPARWGIPAARCHFLTHNFCGPRHDADMPEQANRSSMVWRQQPAAALPVLPPHPRALAARAAGQQRPRDACPPLPPTTFPPLAAPTATATRRATGISTAGALTAAQASSYSCNDAVQPCLLCVRMQCPACQHAMPTQQLFAAAPIAAVPKTAAVPPSPAILSARDSVSSMGLTVLPSLGSQLRWGCGAQKPSGRQNPAASLIDMAGSLEHGWRAPAAKSCCADPCMRHTAAG